jgi:protein-S-isoprenylcysteine O-methyltransferase Ste14
MKANLITLALLMVAIVVLGLHAHDVEWTSVKAAGAVIAVAAVVGLVVARLQLGGSFSVRAKAKKLVTTGVYAKIRNPIYVFGELFILGLSIVMGNWILLLIGVALLPMQIVRAKKEAEVLREAFGEEYVRYKVGTWF